MISESVKSFSQTVQSGNNDVASGFYAPLLKFTKYTGVSFYRNSRFLIRLLSIGGTRIRTNEIYVATGENYDSPSVAIIRNFNLTTPEVDYFIGEYDDCYILYVKSEASGSVVHAQLIYAENTSFIEPINFEKFDVDKATISEVVPQSNHYYPNLSPNTTLSPSTAGYFKIATINVSYDALGGTCAFSFCENGDGHAIMVGGDVYVKVRHYNANYPRVTLRASGTTNDFTQDYINVIAVATNSQTVEIYVHQPKKYVTYQVMNKFWNATLDGVSIRFEENLSSVNVLPSGEQTKLFT